MTHQLPGSFEDLQHHLGCAGTQLDGVELKIVDGDQRALKQGQEGEIVVRSRSLMNGYLEQDHVPSSSAPAIDSEGWFRTGDLGTIDEGQQLWITGRVKDLIKVKG